MLAAMQAVENIDDVEAATPFIYSQGMLRSKSGISGAVIRGVDPQSVGKVMMTLKNVSLPSDSERNDRTIPGFVLLHNRLAGINF